jgi:hypothetical protein
MIVEVHQNLQTLVARQFLVKAAVCFLGFREVTEFFALFSASAVELSGNIPSNLNIRGETRIVILSEAKE